MIANLLLKSAARKVCMFYFIFLFIFCTHIANADMHSVIRKNERKKNRVLNKFICKLAYAEHLIISNRIESSNQNPF